MLMFSIITLSSLHSLETSHLKNCKAKIKRREKKAKRNLERLLETESNIFGATIHDDDDDVTVMLQNSDGMSLSFTYQRGDTTMPRSSQFQYRVLLF